MHINTVFAPIRHSLTRPCSYAPVEKTIKQKIERVKCCYVNVCKWSFAPVSVMLKWWQAFSMIGAHWGGKKMSASRPRGSPSPLQPKPQMGVFIVHCTPHLGLQKSLVWNLELCLMYAQLAARLNHWWSSKLSQRFISELTTKILFLRSCLQHGSFCFGVLFQAHQMILGQQWSPRSCPTAPQ